MKRLFIFSSLLVLFFMACKPKDDTIKPEPQPIVKKYLTKQLFNGDTNTVALSIDWNEDFSQIKHITNRLPIGYDGWQVDYDFTYYGVDSIRILLSRPGPVINQTPAFSIFFNKLILHLRANKIQTIDCYADDSLWFTEEYSYNTKGQLTTRTSYFDTGGESYEWKDGNVFYAETLAGSPIFYYDSLTSYIYPHYNFPFVLSAQQFVNYKFLLYPVCKYAPKKSGVSYEADKDGYVIKEIFGTPDSTRFYYTYHYAQPKK